MPFTDDFINNLGDESYKKAARLFNEIPTSPSYLMHNMPGMAQLNNALSDIKELAKKPSAKNIKDSRGSEIAAKLSRMDPSPQNPHFTQYSMSELASISSMLKNQYPDNIALAKAIDAYHEAYYQAYNALNKPTGIYQILVGAQLLMDKNIPHQYEKSEQGQLFLLNNIVKPIIDIYEELEKRNLQANDVSNIRLIIQEMENEVERYIADTNRRIAAIQEDDPVSKLRKAKLSSEIDELKRFSIGVKKELNHICDKIIAVETHTMKKQLKGNVNDRELKKAEREIIKDLNRKASKSKNLDYIKHSKFREYGEEKAQQHHGSQVLPLNQSKLPEMGSSYGLCFGYSSLFLDVCDAPNWNDLSQEEKINKFKEQLAPKTSEFEYDRSNRLKMNLAAGLKYDAQFIKSCPEAINKDVNAATGKKLNLAEQLPASLIEQPPPKDILIAIYSNNAGHALSYREDLNGTIWFHDSNSGLYSFANKKDFSDFLGKYISSYYSEFDQRFSLFDYKTLREIADKNIVIPLAFRPENVKKIQTNENSAVSDLNLPLPPSASPLSKSNENLSRKTSSRPRPLLLHPVQNQDANPPGGTQPGRKQALVRTQATRFITNNQPAVDSPLNEMINRLQAGMANLDKDSRPGMAAEALILSLIDEIQSLHSTDKSPTEKMERARNMIQAAETKALLTIGDGGKCHLIIRQALVEQENTLKPKK